MRKGRRGRVRGREGKIARPRKAPIISMVLIGHRGRDATNCRLTNDRKEEDRVQWIMTRIGRIIISMIRTYVCMDF